METENKIIGKPHINPPKYGRHPKNVVFEILAGEELRRFIIPYDEWMVVHKWYCDPSITEDYLLRLDGDGESCRIIRLDKKISEIRVIELTRSYLISRNISHILMYSIPGAMKFTVPLIISAAIWILTGLFSLIKGSESAGAEGAANFVELAVKLSSLAFVLFLLLNIQFAIIRIINAVSNKYDALLYDDDAYFTDSLVFHSALTFIVVVIGVQNIVNIIKGILESFKAVG
jgi:hypothetical protein